MLKAVFSDGIDEITVTGLTQWDTGQKLEITLADLPTNFQVHFAQYRKTEIAYVVEATSTNGVAVVSIPNIILQIASNACAWIYIPSDDGHETIKTINLPIQERARPADYVYEEEEILYFEKVMDITEQAAQRAEEAQAEAEQSANECKEAQGKIEGFEEYNRNNYSNSLKANASGEVVRVDDVSPAQHTVKAKVRGKNLLKPVENKEMFGITMTVGDDGGYTFNGTATGGHFSFSYDLDLEPGTYAIAAHNSIGMGSGGADAPYMALRKATGEWMASRAFTKENAEIIFTANEPIKSFLFAIPEGVTVENYTIYLQLEKGATVTDFVPCFNPSSVKVTRCGKNLLPYPFYQASSEINGCKFTANSDGSVSASGTATGVSYLTIYNGKPLVKQGNFTISLGGSYQNIIYHLILLDSAGNELLVIQDYLTKTINVNDYPTATKWMLNIKRHESKMVSGRVYPQIEVGKTATSHEGYIKPVEYTPNADGTVDGILSVAPTMTILTDTEGANLEVEYNQDINVVADDISELLDLIVGGE